MSTPRFIPEFKEEAIWQIVERGHPVSEVSERLGVSAHSLYKLVKTIRPDKSQEQAAELIAAKSEILSSAQSFGALKRSVISKKRPLGTCDGELQ